MAKGVFLVMLYYQVLVYFQTERGLSHGPFSQAKTRKGSDQQQGQT